MPSVPEKNKLLIVDDNPHNIYSFELIVKSPGVEILTANSGEEALQRLLDHPDVDLILMDVQMPGMDGFETTELIRGQPRFRDIPILFVTAVYRSDEFARYGFRTGASDYITKPVDNDVLESKVKVFLTLQNQKKKLAREIEARRRAEEQVRHLNAVLEGIRNVCQLIVREQDRKRLVQGACDRLVEARGFLSAWIGLVYRDGVPAVAVQAGLGDAFAPAVETLAVYAEFPPCGQKVMEQGGQVVVDVSPDTCPGCPLLDAHGSQQAVATRLDHGGRAFGLLVVSFPPSVVVDAREQGLLAEVAGDLALALWAIDQEEARRRVEAEHQWLLEETRELARDLQASEEQLLLAVQGSRTGLWSWDIVNDSLYWSPELKGLLDYADDELEVDFDRFASMLHPDDSASTRAALDAHLEARVPYEVEQRLRTKTGEYRWFLVRGQAVWDAEGRAVRMAGSTADITEHKQAQEALRQQARQLALLNEIGRQLTAFLDLDEVLKRAAQLVYERFGCHYVGLFTRQAGQDRLVMSAKAGELAHLFPDDFSVALGEGMIGWVGLHGQTLLANDVAVEPHFVNPFPDQLPTRSELCVPIRIGDEIVGVLDLESFQPGAFSPSDVTTKETLAGQIAVAINNARLYSQVAQHNRDLTLLNRLIAVTSASADAEIELVLEIVCRELAMAYGVPHVGATLYNHERTESVVVAEYLAQGRPSILGDVIPASIPACRLLLEEKAPQVVEITQDDEAWAHAHVHDRAPQEGTTSLLLVPLMGEGEVLGSLGLYAGAQRSFAPEEVDLAWHVAEQVSGVLARIRLAEERKQLEEQFRQSQKLEAVGRLAGGIAHDFNNLLTVIYLSTRLLERKISPQDPLWENVHRIQDAGQRATSLTRQLLAFSRREIVEPRVLDLNEALGEIDKMLRRIIGEDIDVKTVLADGLWRVKIDPTQVDQMVMNLVVNARDAMLQGGTLTIETGNVVLDQAYAARHLDVEPGDYVLLAISDSGVGMTDEVKSHLFEPFFTTKEKGKGTGLGLATVFGIVKQNNGHIWVYSEPGQGTTFKVYLPRVEDKVEVKPSTLTLPSTSTSDETLLLVEDEDEVRILTGEILAAQGYHILAARDGREAVEVAERHDGPIHLLLTDVVMPQMSGRAVAEWLLSGHPEMRVLYTSGHTDNAIVHHGVLAEGTAFLSKPYDQEALIRKVREVLARP